MANVIRYTPPMMLANVLAAMLVAAALWPAANRALLLAWTLAIVGLCGTVFLRRRWRAPRSRPPAVSERAIRLAVRNALILGCLWASLPLLFFETATSGGQLVIACLSAGVLCAAASGLASIPVAATVFTAPVFTAMAFAIARTGEPTYLLAALLLAIYGFVILRVVFTHGLQLVFRLVEQLDAERRVRTDHLTHLLNRAGFQERFDEALRCLSQSGTGFAVFCFDLDNFKGVNDRLGHAAGDDLLVQVAARLERFARTGDTLARLGGDEFALIAANVACREVASNLAGRILDSFERPFSIEGQAVPASVSIGISLAPQDGTDARTLLKSADIALYRAKASHSGSLQFFEAKRDARSRERRALELDLRQALREGELHLVYQPFLDLSTGQVTGCEALIRWSHPVRGNVPPLEFIPVAEDAGLIQPIGSWVVREACRAAAGWPKHMRVAVNLSPSQLREPEIVATIMGALAQHELAPERLEVEITETVLISDDDAPVEILKKLAAFGVRIALDDFGTGYSSLNYLRKLPLHRIKIDRSFVRDLVTDRHSASIVRAIIDLASDLGIATTAEGVETEQQLAHLRAQRCGDVQGYLISMPGLISDILPRLEELERRAA